MPNWKNLQNIVTPPVLFILKEWDEIQREYTKYSPSIALTRFIRLKYVEEDQKRAKEFYRAFKKSKSTQNPSLILWNNVYYDYFGSVHLYDKLTDISFAFPYQARQWPYSKLHHKIINHIENESTEKEKVGLRQFLSIWLKLRLKEVIQLSEKDIRIIRQILNTEIDDSLVIINNTELANKTNLPLTTVNYRLKKLERTNIFSANFVTNPSRIGFITFLSTKDYPNLKLQALARVEFDRYTLSMYQIPSSWYSGHEKNILTTQEIGFAPSVLGAKGKHQTEVLLDFDDITTHSMYVSRKIDIISYKHFSSPDKIKIFLHFMPAFRSLDYKPAFLAKKFDMSPTKVRNILKEFQQTDTIYPHYKLDFVGFSSYVVIFAKAEPSVLEKLKHYCRQYFHYRFYSNKNLILIHLRIQPQRYNVLKQELEKNKDRFDFINIRKIEYDKQNFFKVSISAKDLNFSIDDFFGIRWEGQGDFRVTSDNIAFA